MDKNGAMDRRFSLNMSTLPNPIAESTCVNLNGTTSAITERNSTINQFRWGGSPISQKNRSNSSICLNSSSANKSTATSPQRARLNLSKIDPRTYADVQSRGLVSRIIQYHESSSRLNRSKSTSNLCSKSGQYSIAPLQKTDLPYRATQQNVAMTRIAPPKKSIFYGNTLSSLLRSNSVISVQKSDEEISSENRPILHPPPTESELAPTRSVLDVLKEISRKRINSDDSDGIHDVNKKYCSRESNDTSYDPLSASLGVRGVGMHNMNPQSIHVPSQSFKRQREHIVIPSSHTQNMNSACGTTFSSVRLPLQTQHSPEQLAKKRLCSLNNDITSSLSSSLIHANKRKFYEQQRSNKQRSPPSGTEEYETQKSKMHRQQSDLRFHQLTQSLSCNTPITPIPTTPSSQSNSVAPVHNIIENGTDRLTESGGTVKRTVSEPPLLLNNQTQKRKVTLFNRNYNESTKLIKSDGNSGEIIENTVTVDDDECADIQFVKPKKISSIVNKKNPLIERTQKSKLAMMLSGLRGEIYQGEEGYDEVDKLSNKNSGSTTNTPIKKDVSVSKEMTPMASTATAISTHTAANFTMKNPDKSTKTLTSVLIPPMSASDNTTKSTALTSTVEVSLSSSTPSLPMPTATTTTSILGDFKLAPAPAKSSSLASTNASPIISTTSTATKTASPLVGLKLTPQKPTNNFGSSVSSSAPTFNLNDATATTTTASATLPQLQGFSFGAPTKPTSTTVAPVTSTAVVTSSVSVGGFKFGLTTKPEVSTTVARATNASAFGNFGNSMTTTATPVSSEAAKPAITFGANAISTSATVVKPTFNFGGSIAAPALTASTTSATAFNPIGTGTYTFGAATNATTTSAQSMVVQPTVSTAQSGSIFGSNATSNTFKGPTDAAKPFAFATTTSTAQNTSPPTTQPSFSFGGAAVTTANTGAHAATASNLFAFGGQKSTAVTTTASTPFSFGGNNQIAATTTSTTSTINGNVNKSAFNFGGEEKSGAINTNSSNGNLFAFGGSSKTGDNKIFGNNNIAGANNLQPASAHPIQQAAFTFGATPTFGGVSSAATSKPAFGSTTTTAASTPFAFGGSNANKSTPTSSTGGTNNASAGGFNFGASNAGAINGSNTSSTNIFGAATSASAAGTSIAKTPFNFGSATASTSDTAKSIFGGSATSGNTNVASSNNAFGAVTGANSNQTNKTFSFGGTTTVNNNNTSSNLFAAAGNKPSAGGFSFGTSTMGNKPAVSSNATPFAFGGGSTNGGTTATATAAPFSFGSSTGGAPASKTFSFGSSGNAPAPPAANASSIFGGALQSSATTFGFSAGASAPTAPSTVTNIFAPPAAPAGAGQIAGGAAATDRPIRRATRRLQKT
ncbi:nuclear pore complex protein DDB_G0274915 [Bactrocera tryoni]|uniref:nuclear pore complex protein DDB_G0274915 n=1 Tax=Bactrocera tryoni TaxID=59916 RepID=UPI001A962B02|nr:nuclear pore complex protein DDB_G0274915 [Bactrocera tryoni]